MANIVSRLGVLLGLDSAEFVRGIDAASRKLADFSNAVEKNGKIAVVAFSAATVQAVRMADEIADVAKANDLAIDSVLKLSNALMVSGGEYENAGKLISSFTNYVDKAAGGSFEAQKKFADLGISLKDLETLDQQELFNKTIQSLANMQDPITRNAMAMDVLGKAAKGVDWTSVADEIQNTTSKNKEQEQAIKDAADAYDEIQKAAYQFGITLAQSVGPQIKTIIDYIKTFNSETSVLGVVIKTVFETIAVVGANVAYTFQTIALNIEAAFKASGAALKGEFALAGQILGENEVRIKKNLELLNSFQNKVLGIKSAPSDKSFLYGEGYGTSEVDSSVKRKVTLGEDTKGKSERKELQKREEEIAIQRMRNAIANEKTFATEISKIELEAKEKLAIAKQKMDSDNIVENNKFAKQNLELYQQTEIAINLESAQKIKDIRARNNADMAKADLDYLDEITKFLADRENAFGSALLNQSKTIELENISLGFAKQKLEAQNEMRFATDKELKLAMLRLDTEEKIARYKLDKTLDDKGRESIIQQLREQEQIKAASIETEDRYTKIGQVWDSVTDNMTQALDNFVRTGKLNFKDFARSVIQDLIAIQLKAQATSLLRMAIGAFGNMSFGTGAGYGSQDFGGFLDSTSIATRAEGGPLESGQLSMVGERGPELFVPRSAGTIVPNNALSGMGSTTNVTNNYISAIDVKSFEERLYGSAKAIWAANAYAAKGLATSSGRA